MVKKRRERTQKIQDEKIRAVTADHCRMTSGKETLQKGVYRVSAADKDNLHNEHM